METCSTVLHKISVKEEPVELSFGLTSLDSGHGMDPHFPCPQYGGHLSTTVDVSICSYLFR